MTEIVCGRCTHAPDAPRGEQLHHRSVSEVKACYDYARTYGAESVFRCSWLYQAGHDEDGEPIILSCDAPAHETDRGWDCFNGHEHLTYGSPAQQAEERVEAMVEVLASRNGNIAGRLDAGETWQRIAGF
jgi:hypothetical protein